MSKRGCVYKNCKKNVKFFGKYIGFTPHPNSLDGINASSQTELKKYSHIYKRFYINVTPEIYVITCFLVFLLFS